MIDIVLKPGVETRLDVFRQAGSRLRQRQLAWVRIWPAMPLSADDAVAA
jgi:hypothetical protein